MEDGKISAAVRILWSDDRLSSLNSDIFEKLKAKHPAPTASNPALPDPDLIRPLQVSEDEVLKAVHSFPAGSAGGSDGLRP